MTLTYPMIGWGTPDDISTFAQVGTATVTSAIADPFGGTLGYLVDDNDAAAFEYRYKPVTFSGGNAPLLTFFVKQGTATIQDVVLYNNTFAAPSVSCRLTWIASVPFPSVIAGSGTFLQPILVGGAWWCIRFYGQTLNTANSFELRLYGATSNSVATTGNTNYYLRNSVLFHYPNNVLPWAEPRPGSAQAQSVAGVEDAWTLGTDYRLDWEGCWIPYTDLDDPPITGYFGYNESAGVNCGIEAFIKAARDKNVLALVKDRANSTATVLNAYLATPMQGPATLEPNALLRYAFSFRAASPYRSFASLWP
jgi:hypothetical protein